MKKKNIVTDNENMVIQPGVNRPNEEDATLFIG